MKVNISSIVNVEKEFINELLEIFIKENISMISVKVMGKCIEKMVLYIKDSG
jgi:hypothetical protein